MLAWKRLYRYTAGYHRHIDERTPGCWFQTGQDLLHWPGDMKRTKRSGQTTEPWGTPVDIVVQDDDDESILTKDVRFVR